MVMGTVEASAYETDMCIGEECAHEAYTRRPCASHKKYMCTCMRDVASMAHQACAKACALHTTHDNETVRVMQTIAALMRHFSQLFMRHV